MYCTLGFGGGGTGYFIVGYLSGGKSSGLYLLRVH